MGRVFTCVVALMIFRISSKRAGVKEHTILWVKKGRKIGGRKVVERRGETERSSSSPARSFTSLAVCPPKKETLA